MRWLNKSGVDRYLAWNLEKTAYLLLLIFGGALFFFVTPAVEMTRLEDDMLWLIPLVHQVVHSGSFCDIVHFVFALRDEIGVPVLNGSLVALVSLFGVAPVAMIKLCVCIHIANSGLLYFLFRKGLDFGVLASLSGSVMFLCSAQYFHVYLWPIAIQHQLTLVGVIALLLMYFRWFRDPESVTCRHIILMSVSGLLGSFLRVSILLVPVIIIFDSLFRFRENAKACKAVRNVWVPVFSFVPVQLFYIVTMSSGDIFSYLQLNFQGLNKYCIGGLFYAVFFLFGMVILRAFSNIRIPLILKRWFLGGGLCLLPLLVLKNYTGVNGVWIINFIIPYITAAATSVYPGVLIESKFALSRWHVFAVELKSIPGLLGVVLLVTLLIIGFFVAVRGDRRRLLFVPWFCMISPHLLFTGANRVGGIPSRYFVYLIIPLMVLFMIACFVYIPSLFDRRFKRFRLYLQYALTGCFLVMALVHLDVTARITGITRLTACFWSYDYVKISEMLVEYLSANEKDLTFPEKIRVDGVNYDFVNYEYIGKRSGFKNFNCDKKSPFCFTLLSTLSGSCFTHRDSLTVVTGDNDIPLLSYRDGLLSYEGKSLDFFQVKYREAMTAFKDEQYLVSAKAIQAALKKRPFFFRLFPQNADPEKLVALSKGRSVEEIIYLEQQWGHLGIFSKDRRIILLEETLKRDFQAYIELIYLGWFLAQHHETQAYWENWEADLPFLLSKERHLALTPFEDHAQFREVQKFVAENPVK